MKEFAGQFGLSLQNTYILTYVLILELQLKSPTSTLGSQYDEDLENIFKYISAILNL